MKKNLPKALLLRQERFDADSDAPQTGRQPDIFPADQIPAEKRRQFPGGYGFGFGEQAGPMGHLPHQLRGGKALPQGR